MDDYIRELLLESVLWEEAGAPEELQRQLSQETGIQKKQAKESGGAEPEAEHVAVAETKIPEEFPETEASSTRFLRAMEAGLSAEAELGLDRNGRENGGQTWNRPAQETQNGMAMSGFAADLKESFRWTGARQQGDTSGAFGTLVGQAQGEAGMTPEELSMFFQRDARRYS